MRAIFVAIIAQFAIAGGALGEPARPISGPTFQPGETESLSYKTPVRSGVINGIEYSYRIDPQGRSRFAQIGTWAIRVRTDEMTDIDTWHIDEDEARLMVFPHGSSANFCIVGHDFPGRQSMVRIDSRPAMTASGDDCFPSTRLLSDLMKGSKIRTRRYEWPYDYAKDDEGEAAGFPEALRLLEYMKRAKFGKASN